MKRPRVIEDPMHVSMVFIGHGQREFTSNQGMRNIAEQFQSARAAASITTTSQPLAMAVATISNPIKPAPTIGHKAQRLRYRAT
jgi:hypothetical protein